jgi:hypothetical protein
MFATLNICERMANSMNRSKTRIRLKHQQALAIAGMLRHSEIHFKLPKPKPGVAVLLRQHLNHRPSTADGERP